jgi:predicted acetylornithine/succinylornithine family transaminase
MALTYDGVKSLYDNYVISNYGRIPVAIARGEGSYVWDTEGHKYLDFITGLAVNGLGHCNPKIVEAIRKQAGELLHIHNNFIWEQQGRLAEALSKQTTGMGQAKVFFCNSGTEATEAGIKIARLWGKQHGGKSKILSLENSFHGRTYAALSATGQTVYQKGLDPLVPGFSYVPMNNIAALEKAFDDQTVALICEPVQGEGGIFLCEPQFLEAARKLCDQHQALLMYDEVQCGMGRTGKFYAYQGLNLPAPDVFWLAKTLGGGFPIGATVARPEYAATLVPGTHASTFGGNPLASVAALAVCDLLVKGGVLENVRAMGEYLGAGLQRLREEFPWKTKEVRRAGLMAALELSETGKGKGIVDYCRAKGVLVNCTHDTALRLLPPLTVSKTELDEGLKVIGAALRDA